MDLFTQLLNAVKNSPYPEAYYLASAVGIILVFYIVNKILKIVMTFFIIGVVMFGLAVMQGKDPNEMMASLQASFSSIFPASSTNNVGSNNGSYITGTKQNGSNSGSKEKGTQKSFSDMLMGLVGKSN